MKYRLILLITSILLAGCDEPPMIQGYIEGEFLYLSPTSSGILSDLTVKRGQTLHQGDTLFTLETTKLNASIKAASNAIASAEAHWQDLTKGKRSDELAILIQQKIQATAQYDHALINYERAKTLIATGAINQSTFDDRTATKTITKSRLDELNSILAVAKLGVREDQLTVAMLAIDTHRQEKLMLEKQREETSPVAPQAGIIENTFFQPGEFVNAGQPVVTLLPKENIKVRFFVSQRDLAMLNFGDIIEVSCDGCQSIKAIVNYIAPKAEFNPPNVYSNASRHKYTFMVEANFDDFHPQFKPGLPVQVKRL